MPDDYTVKMAERAKAGKKAFEKIQIIDQSMMNELGGRLGDQSRQGDGNSDAAAKEGNPANTGKGRRKRKAAAEGQPDTMNES